METKTFKFPWKEGTPKPKNDKVYSNIPCLVELDTGEKTLLSFNSYYNVWDDESGDDFFCKPEKVKRFIELEDID